VKFTEDKDGFYINDKRYAPSDPPLATVNIGGYQHWSIINATNEIHPFHIHQVHFMTYEENDKPVRVPGWRDTVNLPDQGSIDVVLDFTDSIVRGTSLFHCHLLKHEDKGMMAKVAFR
jgi:FtsP/CotA-like multicopper oxidase with cupredoxin domain